MTYLYTPAVKKRCLVNLNLIYRLCRLRITGRKEPIFVCFYLTNRCNLRCKYCFVIDEKIDKKILSAEFTREETFHFVDEFYALGTRMMFLLGGEPLLHRHIGDIVEYIVAKGIVLDVVTNGTLLGEKYEAVKKAHAVCVSLDGVGEVNDGLRGEGVYERAMAGLKKAMEHGVRCRIHSVVSRSNLQRFEETAKLARELGVPLTVSPPTHIGKADFEPLNITDEEYREFWQKYRELKKQGYPIGNTFAAIDTVRTWPIGYHEIMMDDTPLPRGCKKPVRCVSGDIFCGLEPSGTLYYCVQLGCYRGPNVREVGLRKAWEMLVEDRPKCLSCASINMIENAMMMRLDPGAILGLLKFRFLKK
ncbi:MAG: radical SAM protein [Sedimentisphaerales bacterium]|nr:radical SAM protein [Sedimentisphaerales bacterium]